MKVFTYYNFLNGNNDKDDIYLLNLWRQNWRYQGFEPVILNEYHAQQHPRFEAMRLKAANLPTINPPLYEQACYFRWLAYAQVGGGLVTDWDCFAYCHRKDMKLPLDNPPNVVRALQKHIPSLILGNATAMNHIIEGILNYDVTMKDLKEFGKPHVSDMHMFLNLAFPYNQNQQAVWNYGEEGWTHAPFVHFASAVMQNHLPKWKHIQDLRDWTRTLEEPRKEVGPESSRTRPG